MDHPPVHLVPGTSRHMALGRRREKHLLAPLDRAWTVDTPLRGSTEAAERRGGSSGTTGLACFIDLRQTRDTKSAGFTAIPGFGHPRWSGRTRLVNQKPDSDFSRSFPCPILPAD